MVQRVLGDRYKTSQTYMPNAVLLVMLPFLGTFDSIHSAPHVTFRPYCTRYFWNSIFMAACLCSALNR
jgi:hypothetical protein